MCFSPPLRYAQTFACDCSACVVSLALNGESRHNRSPVGFQVPVLVRPRPSSCRDGAEEAWTAARDLSFGQFQVRSNNSPSGKEFTPTAEQRCPNRELGGCQMGAIGLGRRTCLCPELLGTVCVGSGYFH